MLRDIDRVEAKKLDSGTTIETRWREGEKEPYYQLIHLPHMKTIWMSGYPAPDL